MTSIFNAIGNKLNRRSLLQGGALAGGAAVLAATGCKASVSASSALKTDTGLNSSPSTIPSAQELATSEAARSNYKLLLAKIFGHGTPRNRREIHSLVDSMKLSNSNIGHYAYTIPGNSLEHIKVATQYWAEEFGVGPFVVLESDDSVGQNYYPIVNSTTGERVGDDGKIKSKWPAYTALCKPFPEYYLELNLQTDDTASTYRDMFSGAEGGFHHIAVITEQFDADKKKMESRFQASSSLITNVGAIYYDARKEVGCMFELLETNKLLNFLFLSTYELSKNANLNDYKSTFNILAADISKPKAVRGLTVPRIISLINWADVEGPLADTVDFSSILNPTKK